MAEKLSRMFWVQCGVAVSLCVLALSQAGLAQAGRQPAPLTGLVAQHITISVENIDREAEWYERVLGFKLAKPSDDNPDFLNHHLTIPGYRIDLIKFKGSSRPVPVSPLYLRQGWIHIAFSVPDLSAAWKELQALNTDVTAPNKDAKGVPTRLVVHDPESNEIEFFAPK